MSSRRPLSAILDLRRHGVLLLIAALAFNLVFGAWSHQAAAVGDARDAPRGAVAICSAEGGIRYLLPDGTELPAEQPDDGSQSCPCCFACVSSCGSAQATPAGLNVLALPRERTVTAWSAAASEPLRRPTFPSRPFGQAPPLSI